MAKKTLVKKAKKAARTIPTVTKCTVKEERFCKEYIKHGNGSKSHRDAGYGGNNNHVRAHELLQKTHIQKRIAELNKDREIRTQVTADRTIREHARIAFANHDEIAKAASDASSVADFFNRLSTDDCAAVESARMVTLEKRKPAKPARYDKDGEEIRPEVPEVPEVTELRYVLHDKQKALDALDKIQGLLIIRHSHSDDTPKLNTVRVEDLGLGTEAKKELLERIREAQKEEKEE